MVCLTSEGVLGLLQECLLRLVSLLEGVEGNVYVGLLLLCQLLQALYVNLLDLQVGQFGSVNELKQSVKLCKRHMLSRSRVR